MRIRKIRLTLLGIVILLATIPIFGQVDSGVDLQKMVQIPASPEAAGFQQYGNTSVNLHLGRPSVSIPIHVHQGREMQLPIMLSYASGGIKTLQMASNVGLGWTLIGSGSINRQKLGMADDDGESASYGPENTLNQGFIDNLTIHQSDPSVPRSTANLNLLFTLQEETQKMQADLQPDVYSFNTANGFSGTIYYDYKNAVAYCIEDPTVKVEATLNTAGVPIGWLLYDASGTQYHFTVKEYTQYSYSGGSTEYESSYISSWFLDKMVSPNGKDTYEFNYTENAYWQYQEDLHTITGIENRPSPAGGGSGLGQACPAVPGVESLSSGSNYKVKTQYLSSIEWNDKTIINLGYTGNRLDLPSGQEVDHILVSNGLENLKKVNFQYSHFGSTSNGEITTAERIKLRLKLDAISVDGLFGTPETGIQAWALAYYDETNVPPRNTKGVDYWGYYNGNDGNNSLVPPGKFSTFNYGGANRYPDFNATRAGTLKSIHYPTGGHNEFIYELNGYSETSQSVQTNTQYLAMVDGGIDLNDPYDYVGYGLEAPKAVTGTFTIDDNTEDFLVSILATGTLSGGDVYVHVFPDIISWNHAHAQQVSGGIDQVFDELEMANSQTISIDGLTNGTYRYLIYNSIANSTVEISYTETTTITAGSNISIGGLRVESIESYTKTGELAGKRQFEYDEAQIQKDLDFDDIKQTKVRNGGIDYTCTSYYRYSNNRSTDVGKDISYGKVTERLVDGNNTNGRTVHYFINEDLRTLNPYSMHRILNGREMKQEVFDAADTPLMITENTYAQQQLSGTGGIFTPAKGAYFITNETVVGYRRKINGSAGEQSYEYIPWHTSGNMPPGCTSSLCDYGSWAIYQAYPFQMDSYFSKLESSITTQFLDGNSLMSLTTYDHNETSHFQLISQTMEDSQGDTWTNKRYYPNDVSSITSLPNGDLESDELIAINKMKENHQINSVLQTEQTKNTSTLISSQRTNYKFEHGRVQPESIETAKATNGFQTRLRFNSYYENGNPKEVSQEGGQKIVYLWAYNNTFPVAKIDNANYSDVSAVIDQSILDNPDNDTALRLELDKLRTAPSLKYAMVTTMTYKLGVGMTSQTSPNGITSYFEYDSFGRLKYIRDQDGNILKANEYEYKVNANTTGN